MRRTFFGPNSLENSVFNNTSQVCVVTADLDKMVRTYSEQLGIGPWWIKLYEAPQLINTTYRGEKIDYSFEIALAWTGDFSWEIIRPVSGPSIYRDFLEKNGDGIQHVGYFMPDLNMSLEDAKAEFISRGASIVQEGGTSWGIDWFYFEPNGATGTVFEVIDKKAGFDRPEPDRWYPAPPNGEVDY